MPNPPPPPLPDRQLAIVVKPTLIWASENSITATIIYTQVLASPPMGNVVNPHTGAIDLTKMSKNKQYTDNVDITIQLDQTPIYDPSGNVVPIAWANVGDPLTNPMNGIPPNTPWAWFCATPAPSRPYVTTPVMIPDMASIRISANEVLIDDDTPLTAATYIFCLGLVLWPDSRRYFITIDPTIVGKGVGNK